VQRAIERDLLELQRIFHHQVSSKVDAQQQQRHVQHQMHKPRRRGECTSSSVKKHDKEGIAFSLFTAAKVPLLHTRFIPPRCNHGKFSQLIYASCLSLIEQAFLREDCDEDDFDAESMFSQAAHALFCLHALFEANPLPQAPCGYASANTSGSTYSSNTNPQPSHHQKQIKEELELLPMGVQSSDGGSKMMYRRSFRRPIRIGRFQFSLFLQLREEALRRQAKCQQKCTAYEAAQLHGRIKQSKIENKNNEFGNASAIEWHSRESEQGQAQQHHTYRSAKTEKKIWACHCGVATDAICILNRVFPNLDLCAYTGPRSVEGLANQAHYPFPGRKPSKGQEEATQKSRRTKLKKCLLDELLEVIKQREKEEESYHSLPKSIAERRIELYHTSLRSFQIPQNLTRPKMQRLKDSLLPILKPTGPSREVLISRVQLKSSITKEQIQQQLKSSPAHRNSVTDKVLVGVTRRQLRSRRHVTWAELDKNKNNDAFRNSSISVGGSANECQSANGDIPRTRQNTCNVAQDMLYELVLPVGLPTTLQKGIQNALAHILERDQPMFLPTDGTAEANSVTSTTQDKREKLNNVSSIGTDVVSTAHSSATNQGGAALAALLEEAQKTTLTTSAYCLGNFSKRRKLFFAMDDDDDNICFGSDEGDDRSDTSNLSTSDMEEDDAVSVATSAAGQTALTTLLSSVSHNHSKERSDVEQDDATSVATSSAGRKARTMLLSSLSHGRGKNKEGSMERDDALSVGTSTAGQDVFSMLLSELPSNQSESKENGMEQDDILSVETSAAGQRALTTLLSSVFHGESKRKESGNSNKRKTAPREIAKAKGSVRPCASRSRTGVKAPPQASSLQLPTVHHGNAKKRSRSKSVRLSQAEEGPTVSTSSRKTQQSKISVRSAGHVDEASATSSHSGYGRKAVGALLSRVGQKGRATSSLADGTEETEYESCLVAERDEESEGITGLDNDRTSGILFTSQQRKARQGKASILKGVDRGKYTTAGMGEDGADNDTASSFSGLSGQGNAALAALLSHAPK